MVTKEIEVKQISVKTLGELNKELDKISDKTENIISIHVVILLNTPLCDVQHSD